METTIPRREWIGQAGLLLSLAALAVPVLGLSPLPYPGITGPTMALRVIIPALVILWVLQRHPPLSAPLTYALAAYAAAMTLSGLLGVDPWLSWLSTSNRLTGIFDQLLWIGLAFMLPTFVAGRWRPVFGLLTLVAAWMALWAIIEHVLYGSTRPVGLTVNAGILGVAVMPGIITAVWLGQRNPRWYPALPLIVLALHLSGARAALAGLLVGMCVLLLLARRWRVALPSVAVVGALGLLTVAGVSLNESPARDVTSSHSTEERVLFWDVAIEAVLDRPLTGWGAGAFLRVDEHYRPDAEVRADYPHNMVLQEIAEKGALAIPTFVLGAMLVWGLRRDPLPLAILVGIGVYALFWFISLHMMLWVVAVIGYALARERATPKGGPFHRGSVFWPLVHHPTKATVPGEPSESVERDDEE